MTALVFGASGLTGRAVVERLRRFYPNEKVVAHIRPESPSRERLSKHFESLGALVDTTSYDHANFEEKLASHSPSIVFSLIGTTQKRLKTEPKEMQSYTAIDERLSLKAFDVAKRANARFVFLSSLGADKPSNDYLRARYNVEQVVRKGSNWVIAQPSLIVGDRDEPRALEKVANAMMKPVLGPLSGVFSSLKDLLPIESEDLAQGLVRTAHGEASNLVVRTARIKELAKR